MPFSSLISYSVGSILSPRCIDLLVAFVLFFAILALHLATTTLTPCLLRRFYSIINFTLILIHERSRRLFVSLVHRRSPLLISSILLINLESIRFSILRSLNQSSHLLLSVLAFQRLGCRRAFPSSAADSHFGKSPQVTRLLFTLSCYLACCLPDSCISPWLVRVFVFSLNTSIRLTPPAAILDCLLIFHLCAFASFPHHLSRPFPITRLFSIFSSVASRLPTGAISRVATRDSAPMS